MTTLTGYTVDRVARNGAHRMEWPVHGYFVVIAQLSVVSDSLRRHGLHHARLPCPSPSPRVCSNSCSLSQWHHPTTSPSVIPFSSCPQSFPASQSFAHQGLFQWVFGSGELFASGGPSIRASALASVLPVKIQGWFQWLPAQLIVELRFKLRFSGPHVLAFP